ncbi:MAG: MFS transporter, partial [Rhodococcus sp.]|nr:MFS transporter [Rhodococcus sp. (in: high G+C Gram-positive bacteria)]
SQLVTRIAPRWLILCGAVIMVGWLLVSVTTMDADSAYFPGLFFPVIGIGFGVGLTVVPLPLCAIAGVSPTEIGPLTAISLVAQTLGGPLALAVIGALVTSRTLSLGGISGPATLMNDSQLDALSSGYMFALFCCAVCAVIAGVAALFIRFTPQQVAQAQAAQEDAQKG